MKSVFASLPMLVLCLLIGACSTTPQPLANFPRPPAALMEPPPGLVPLPGEGVVSPQAAAETVAQNYGLYHRIAAQLAELQAWVKGARGSK